MKAVPTIPQLLDRRFFTSRESSEPDTDSSLGRIESKLFLICLNL